MKVLYLHQYFATPEVNAGTRSYEVSKKLVSRGYEVEFITTSAYLPKNIPLKRGWNSITIGGVKLNVLKQDYSNKLSYFKRSLRFLSFCWRATLKALSIKCDVVYATSTPLTIAIPAVLYKMVKKKPLVFEVRDLWPELPIAVGALKNPVLIWAAKKLERFAYFNSDSLVGLSPGMCQGIIKQGIDKERVFLASNSCDTELFSVEPSVGEEYRATKLGFAKNRKLVVYTGTFGVINGVSYIVKLAEAMKRIDNSICFLAIGDGMERVLVEKLAVETSVLDDNFFLLPPVPKTEVVSLLSTASLALSLFGPVKEMWHNSANKLFDSLAAGTPIAINYGGWQSEFIKEFSCGVVLDSEDYEKAALTISDFLSCEFKQEIAKESCRLLASEKFSREQTVKQIEKAIRNAVN